MITIERSIDGVASEVKLITEIRLSRQMTVDFGDDFTGTGWYGAEPAGDRNFRWMGEVATVVLTVDRSVDLEFVVDIHMIIDSSKRDAITFSVDGAPVEAFASTEEGLSFCLDVPQSTADAVTSELKIFAPFGVIPYPDPRKVAIAVSRIAVRPRDGAAEEGGQSLVLRTAISSYLKRIGRL